MCVESEEISGRVLTLLVSAVLSSPCLSRTRWFHQPMKTYAFDYETFYSKDYSIRGSSNWQYTHHPEFDAFLLAVAGDDGFEWVGHPKDFNWTLLNGAIVLAHNAPFEEAVTNRLKELGIIPAGIEFAALFDTADLAAYLGYPRSLKEAAFHLLDMKMDKDARSKAKGKHWDDMDADFQKVFSTYALTDAKTELAIWLKHNHKWPKWERQLSQMTREMCAAGLPVDMTQVLETVSNLQTQLWKTRTMIPWAEDPEAPALSPKLVATECRKCNIPPPKSMAKDSEVFDNWLKTYGDIAPWALAIGQYRRINAMLKKMETMRDRTKEDGTMPIGIKYGGAHTMRDSGDTGWNPQNLSRFPFFFDANGLITDSLTIKNCIAGWKKGATPDYVTFIVDMRGCICAPEGKVLGVSDLAAIEPCVLACLSENHPLLALLRKGYGIYEAHARATGRWTGEGKLKIEDPEKYAFMKVEVLGLGYGAGADKLIIIAKTLADIDLTFPQSEQIVLNFRKSAAPIPALWRKLERFMANSAPGDFEMELPSGRLMRYRKVVSYHGLTAEIPRLGKMMRVGFWGGSLTENITQGGARDVFMDRCIKLKEEGLPPILRAHDESVQIFDEDTAEDNMKTTLQIMGTAPTWMPDLPISAEGFLTKRYRK